MASTYITTVPWRGLLMIGHDDDMYVLPSEAQREPPPRPLQYKGREGDGIRNDRSK